ncbi:hypothetical protein HNQ64_002060 [Prosthecobacter dejongeii]|uniref:Uncharacterized protein n=1 Tax=Prosthecobacter dejongeii TaxID=48465 RepID=A0A7W7YKD7_9BACT|nr:hypothetical protein [Prosthecobacter dejongeii]
MNKDGRFETSEVHFSWHRILESDAGTPACKTKAERGPYGKVHRQSIAGRSARITFTWT